jgi:hypothetical protein
MTRDDIIRLAQEAGIVDWSLHGRLESKEEALERFAALVAAAEREACAKLCEEIARRNEAECDIDWVTGNMECADYIRARGAV